MAPEISVERQFRFHCSCGATTISGEKEVTCSGCGCTLGLRRIRRQRQRRDFVAYYGASTPLPPIQEAHEAGGNKFRRTALVHRVQRSGQNVIAIGRTPGDRDVVSRLACWLKSIFVGSSNFINLRLAGDGEDAKTAVQTQASTSSPDAAPIPSLPTITTLPPRTLAEGKHVKVAATSRDGKPHPHAGQTGRIVRFIDDYSEPYLRGGQSAMIELAVPTRAGRFIWVSVEYLEAQTDTSNSTGQ